MKTLDRIHKYVDNALELKIDTPTRKRDYVEGRFLFFAIAREITGYSLDRIGKHLNKDHSSVLHSVKVFKDVLIKQRRYKNLYYKYVDKNYIDPTIKIEIKNSKLEDKVMLLEIQNVNLKKRLREKLDFIDGFYSLTSEERENVRIRVQAIIKMQPSIIKVKECDKFQTINCAV